MNKKLNIVIVNCVFHPEPVVSAKMSNDLALHLSSIGHKVDVICPMPSRPISFDYSTYVDLPIEIVNENLTIHRLNSYSNPASSLIGRFRESYSFGLRSGRYLTKNLKDSTIVYANTWPLMGQYFLAKACKKLKLPLIFHIKDVYPESMLKKLNSVVSLIISKPLFYIEKFAMKYAKLVILLSEKTAIHYVLTRNLASSKVETCLDWQNSQPFVDYKDEIIDEYKNFGIEKGLFTFMYMGNIGPVAGVEMLIESFYNANIENSQLIIAGDGSKRADCAAFVTKLGMSNVKFVQVPNGKVPGVQSIADVLILPVKKGEAYNSVPSKLISYLFSSKPVLASLDVDSDTSGFITSSNVGWVVEPENIDLLTNKMVQVAKLSKAELTALGENGFKYGIEQFSMEAGVKKLTELIVKAV